LAPLAIKIRLLRPAGLAGVRIIERAGHVGLVLGVHGLQGFGGLLFHRELDGVGGGFGAQVVHAGFEAALPAVEVHAGELAEVGVLHVQVQALALADVGTPVGGHVDDGALRNLPHRLVQVLDVLRHAGDALHRAIGRDDVLLHLLVPEAQLH
jgi:hypothetical protein